MFPSANEMKGQSFRWYNPPVYRSSGFCHSQRAAYVTPGCNNRATTCVKSALTFSNARWKPKGRLAKARWKWGRGDGRRGILFRCILLFNTSTVILRSFRFGSRLIGSPVDTEYRRRRKWSSTREISFMKNLLLNFAIVLFAASQQANRSAHSVSSINASCFFFFFFLQHSL